MRDGFPPLRSSTPRPQSPLFTEKKIKNLAALDEGPSPGKVTRWGLVSMTLPQGPARLETRGRQALPALLPQAGVEGMTDNGGGGECAVGLRVRGDKPPSSH